MSETNTLPKSMEAIEIVELGGPNVLQVKEVAVPSLANDEVLIKVHASGVNRPDCLQRMGQYAPPKGASEIPGLEVSGEIIAVGDGADKSVIGSHVMALVSGGGYAQYVNVSLTNTLPIPQGLSMVEAASIPETFFTVWHNVFQRGGLNKGEIFLVHGGTSGIGTTAIQLAKSFGATVITTAGSQEKCDACLALGADLAINYHEQDFVEVVKEFTQKQGANLILDMVGGEYTERNYDACAMDGRIVQIAFLGGAKAKVNFAKLMMKRLTHTGSTLRPRSIEFKALIAEELKAVVWPKIETGEIKPVLYKQFPLKDAAKAHTLMESGEHIGKIVLVV